MPRSRRLTRGTEIRQVLTRGKRSRTAHLDVFVSPSPAPHSRIGIVVPRFGQTAVRRNRLKRRLKEILRREILPWFETPEPSRDILVRARPPAYSASFAQLRAELLEWLDESRSGSR